MSRLPVLKDQTAYQRVLFEAQYPFEGNQKEHCTYTYKKGTPPWTYLFDEFTGICSVFYPFLGFGESNEKEAFPRTFWKLQA